MVKDFFPQWCVAYRFGDIFTKIRNQDIMGNKYSNPEHGAVTSFCGGYKHFTYT